MSRPSAAPLPLASLRQALAHGGPFHQDGAPIHLTREQRTRYLGLLDAFGLAFGDGPVVLVRAPGRINLRGMHVDTHGGWLNLATHQREIALVMGAGTPGRIEARNLDARFSALDLALDALPPRDTDWSAFLASMPCRRLQDTVPEGWGRYVAGATLRNLNPYDEGPVPGLRAVVDGNLPQGAALSSSAALCIAWLLGAAALAGHQWQPEALILAARDAEWFAGARTGTADQAAIVLGKAGQLLHTTLLAEDFSLAAIRWLPIPDGWAVVVAESGTSRKLSGPARVAYGQNRFAYSAALALLRRAMAEQGWSPERIAGMDRLSRMDGESLGGAQAVWRLLEAVPESMDLDALRALGLPGLDEQYQALFDDLPSAQQPQRFPMRAPLIYGLSESERAARFPRWVSEGDGVTAGKAMSIGHDGDRVAAGDRVPWPPEYDLKRLGALGEAAKPLWQESGYYGASSPALDMLVDTALGAGAWGACLTGAGIGGVVLALCSDANRDRVLEQLAEILCTPAYAAQAGLAEALDRNRAEKMLCLNEARPGAGVLRPDGL